jgi:hypothetical protein
MNASVGLAGMAEIVARVPDPCYPLYPLYPSYPR